MNGITNINTNTAAVYDQLGLTQTQQTDKASDQLAQEDFLELMITELKYQDPFNPMDNSEMASQFASFSTVTGIAQLSNSFTSLTDNLTASQSLTAANLIGHEVEIESNQAELTAGGTLDGTVHLDASTSDLQIGLYRNGELVQQLDLGSRTAGEVKFSWDGTTSTGAQAAAGYYQIVANAKIGTETQSQRVTVTAPVESVDLNGGTQIKVNVQGVGAVDLSNILAIL
jgi:flagellar basal-body rod modification protein FlgD